jgi:hypothetical protein
MEPPFADEIGQIFRNGSTVVVDCDQWMNIKKIEQVDPNRAPQGTMTGKVGDTTIIYRVTEDPTLK